MTPCIPTAATVQCANCQRYRPDLPKLAECRPHTIVIDGTVTAKAGERCPFQVEA